jgi:RNA polymerase sigma-70 factor (ECF subfamily)
MEPVNQKKLQNADRNVDAELVTRAKAGEMEAFELLTSQYERQVYSLALRLLRNPHDAEDVTQQTFLSVIEHLGGFREEASFETWLMRIATHAAFKVLRKRRGLEMVSLDQLAESPEDGEPIPLPGFIADWRESPERLVAKNETRRLIEDALDHLDENHRVVFLLRDVEGMSIRETADALNMSEANVKVRLLRARLRLRELLTQAFGDPERRLERGHHHEK